MTLITPTYFEGGILLDVTHELDAINNSIATYAPECLDKVLGAAFAALFESGLVTFTGGGFSSGFSSGFQIGGIDQRWKDLRDGATYTWSNRPCRWMGFINAGKRSLIANYVYYWHQRENVTRTTSTGEVISKNENSTVVSPNAKVCRAWNQMVEWNQELHHFLKNAKTNTGALVYPEFHQLSCDVHLFQKINLFGI